MDPRQRKPEMPQDTWPITKDDKVQIRALGRELHKFLNKQFEGKESVHVKIVVGAFNYIMDLQTQRTKLVGDDFLVAQKSIQMAGFGDKVEEPFEVEPDLPEPTIEQRREALKQQLAELDKEEAGEEVADASPAPEASAAPATEPAPAAPVEAPATPVADPAPVADQAQPAVPPTQQA